MSARHAAGSEAARSEGRNLCVDGDRLCMSQRRRQSLRDESDYLARHAPRCSRVEIGLLLVAAVLLAGAIGGDAGTSKQPPRQQDVETAGSDSLADDWQDFSDVIEWRR